MKANILIEELKLKGIVGIHPHERTNKQDIIIDLELFCDVSAAASSDLIEDSVDYARIVDKVTNFVENSECFLVEKLADQILILVLEDQRIEKARIRLYKPEAIESARRVGIELIRER